MKRRRVVIGLPVYNGQRYVHLAIDSLLAQSFGDFALVVSDNGSTDATPDICAEYARADERVTLMRSNENRGILWNHRRVMEAIQGDDQYFRWAGADDIVEQGLLQSMVDVLDQQPDVVAAMPNTKNIDDEGQVVGVMPRSLDIRFQDVVERARHLLLASYQHVMAYGLIRASVLRSMRTGPNYPGWDDVFAWELVLRGLLVQTDGAALLRRFHSGSISRVKTAKELRKWVEPQARTGMAFPHWKWSYERVRCLMGAPMSLADRGRVVALLGRSTVWQRAALTRDVTQAMRRALGLSDEYTF